MCTVKHNADIGPAGKFNDHLVKTFYFDRWEARVQEEGEGMGEVD